jgi:hypothetical protein
MTVPPGITDEMHHDDPAMILILEPQKAALRTAWLQESAATLTLQALKDLPPTIKKRPHDNR